MTTQTLTKSQQDKTVEKKVQELRQLFADAPQFAKTALENSLRDLASTGRSRDQRWKALAGPAAVRARSRS